MNQAVFAFRRLQRCVAALHRYRQPPQRVFVMAGRKHCGEKPIFGVLLMSFEGQKSKQFS